MIISISTGVFLPLLEVPQVAKTLPQKHVYFPRATKMPPVRAKTAAFFKPEVAKIHHSYITMYTSENSKVSHPEMCRQNQCGLCPAQMFCCDLVQEVHYPYPQVNHPDEMQHPEKNPAVCKWLGNPIWIGGRS